MTKKVILDTNIYVGMTFANNHDCENLQDYILEHPELVIAICPKIIDEVCAVLCRSQVGVQMFYRHILHPFKRHKKILEFKEGEKPADCILSHDDDYHLIECAKGSDCQIIVTKDGKLRETNCGVKIFSIADFYNYCVAEIENKRDN